MKKGIFKDSLKITVLSSISQVLGLVVTLSVANFFGANSSTDSFYLAISIPELFVSIIVGGGLRLVLLPLFVELKELDNNTFESFKKLSFYSLLAIAVVLVIIILMVLVFLRGRCLINTEFLEISLILLPLVPIGFLNNYFNTIYNAYKKFGILEISTAIKFLTILLILLISRSSNILILAYAYVIGSSIGLLYTIYIFINAGLIRFRFQVKEVKSNEQLKPYVSLAVLGILAYIFARLNPFFARIIANSLDTGDVTIYALSEKVALIPSMLIGTTFTSVLVSHWTSFNINSQYSTIKESLEKSISFLLFLLIPTIIGINLVSDPLVEVLFGNGQIPRHALPKLSLVFGSYSAIILPNYIHMVLARILHINKELKVNLILAIGGLFFSTLFMWLIALLLNVGLIGLVIGQILGSLLVMIASFYFIYQKYFKINLNRIFLSLLKSSLAAISMGFALHIVSRLTNLVHPLTKLLIYVPLGAIVFVAISLILKSRDLETAISKFKK